MGWRLLREVLDFGPDGLSWRERRTLEVLAFHALDDGPDARLVTRIEQNPRLLKQLRLSRTQRFATLAVLIQCGALERAERGRNNAPAVYRLPVFSLPLSHEKSVPPETGTLRTLNRDPSSTSSIPETGTLKASRKPGPFEEFWRAYPRRAGKADASKAFAAALAAGADPEELTGAATRFAASLNGVPPGKICRPARWLAERWWLDYPPETQITLPNHS